VWLPVPIIPRILFTTGVSWFLAALGVFARDLGMVLQAAQELRGSAVRRGAMV
jgi:ABC-type polysaccharide/polyol phosphate export permease